MHRLCTRSPASHAPLQGSPGESAKHVLLGAWEMHIAHTEGSCKSAATHRCFNKLDEWLIKALPRPAGGWICYSAPVVPWLRESTPCSSRESPGTIRPAKVSRPEMSAGKQAMIFLALQRWFCMYCLASQQDWADDRQGWWEKLFSPEPHKARESSCHSSQLASCQLLR